MSTPLTSLLTAIRKRCKSGLWSKGVTLARDGGVAIESQTAEEIVLRVRAPGRPVAPTVVLYPAEPEWECDCPSQFSPCEHAAGPPSRQARVVDDEDPPLHTRSIMTSATRSTAMASSLSPASTTERGMP